MHHKTHNLYKQDTRLQLEVEVTVFSGTGEKVGFQSSAGLFVPLPRSESDYIKDFKTNESKEEFLALLWKADKCPITRNWYPQIMECALFFHYYIFDLMIFFIFSRFKKSFGVRTFISEPL